MDDRYTLLGARVPAKPLYMPLVRTKLCTYLLYIFLFVLCVGRGGTGFPVNMTAYCIQVLHFIVRLIESSSYTMRTNALSYYDSHRAREISTCMMCGLKVS